MLRESNTNKQLNRRGRLQCSMGTEVISDSRDATLTTLLFLFLQHHSIHMKPLVEFLFHICSCVFDYIYFSIVQWASLVAQLVKNLPVMQEILVRFLIQKEPLEKGSATHSSILGLLSWFRW